MSDWPIGVSGQYIEAEGIDYANSQGTTVTADASANTKGAWVELVASTSRNADWFQLIVGWWGGAAGDFLIDIGIGGAGSEQVALSNVLFTVQKDQVGSYLFPYQIPAGTRLSARLQCTTGGSSIRVAAYLISGSQFLKSTGISRITPYGINTADSGGVSVDPGASANTKGSWVEIVASTTYPIRYLLVVTGNQDNITRSACKWLLDIGIGGAGSEIVKIPDIFAVCSNTSDNVLPIATGFEISIPTGTRLSARLQCSITDAADRLMDIALYGAG